MQYHRLNIVNALRDHVENALMEPGMDATPPGANPAGWIPITTFWSYHTDPLNADADELPAALFGSAGSIPNNQFGSIQEHGETDSIALHIVVDAKRDANHTLLPDGDLLTRSTKIKDQVQMVVSSMISPTGLNSGVIFRYGRVETVTRGIGDREMLSFEILIDFAY